MYRPLYIAVIGGYAALIGGIILGRMLFGSAQLPVVVIALMVLYGSAISAAALWCERSRQGLH